MAKILENKARYRAKNRDKLNEASKRYHKKLAKSGEAFRRYLLYKYSISLEEYERLQYRQQGKCAIKSCNRLLNGGRRRSHLDHMAKNSSDFSCVVVNHNIALGMVEDNIQELLDLIEYLRGPNLG